VLAESVGLVGVEDLRESVDGDVAQGMAMILIVAAREDIA
jgi:type IV secretory pathway VirB2 component (pilin)